MYSGLCPSTYIDASSLSWRSHRALATSGTVASLGQNDDALLPDFPPSLRQVVVHMMLDAIQRLGGVLGPGLVILQAPSQLIIPFVCRVVVCYPGTAIDRNCGAPPRRIVQNVVRKSSSLRLA